MEQYNNYILGLCLIVFVLLVGAFVLFITLIIRNTIRLVKFGIEDINIIKEYRPTKKGKHNLSIWGTMNKIITVILMVSLLLMLILSLSVTMDGKIVGDKPQLKAVFSDSMSYRHENNRYLYVNRIDNQIQMHDLVVLRKLPKEDDIKVFDIIMYERNGTLVLHRVVNIEERNSKHPNERWFTFQGDAVPAQDSHFVTYAQMRGIYTGQRVPFFGSFIHFMHTPAGILCFILVLVVTIFMPFIDKILIKNKLKRLIELSAMDKEDLYNKLQDIRIKELKEVPKEFFTIIDAPNQTIDEKIENLIKLQQKKAEKQLPEPKEIKSIIPLGLEQNREQLELNKRMLQINLRNEQEDVKRQISEIDSKIAKEKRREKQNEQAMIKMQQKVLQEKAKTKALLEKAEEEARKEKERNLEKDKLTEQKAKLKNQKRLQKIKNKSERTLKKINDIKRNEIIESQLITYKLQVKMLDSIRKKKEKKITQLRENQQAEIRQGDRERQQKREEIERTIEQIERTKKKQVEIAEKEKKKALKEAEEIKRYKEKLDLQRKKKEEKLSLREKNKKERSLGKLKQKQALNKSIESIKESQVKTAKGLYSSSAQMFGYTRVDNKDKKNK